MNVKLKKMKNKSVESLNIRIQLSSSMKMLNILLQERSIKTVALLQWCNKGTKIF